MFEEMDELDKKKSLEENQQTPGFEPGRSKFMRPPSGLKDGNQHKSVPKG